MPIEDQVILNMFSLWFLLNAKSGSDMLAVQFFVDVLRSKSYCVQWDLLPRQCVSDCTLTYFSIFCCFYTVGCKAIL